MSNQNTPTLDAWPFAHSKASVLQRRDVVPWVDIAAPPPPPVKRPIRGRTISTFPARREGRRF